ncbi:MAG TPA: ABC transporter substrate-binding protein [Algoriphagus sp.]|jgi:iron complex transport system substrate-binding protein|uniref:heme/hemin ABC transporter substrate-binding protein n=1 Tax=unclassified Algoriphagus TaxID=2641541 RepID=UPI000C5D44B8|nr:MULTISPECIES: ABC transporter substrate-binding protein [unclassified Algoriphagus]MAL13634.1 ABC transporter substrate-binding protein [Algoriphagus sp.]MAN86095.1 ABC transporter substrate-binding protein [Algoriphagus sp.]QYH39963.1 ABC transporter substrate-binding protein [Algoriphagus sp. NBT04N3]HAS58382.1 ABC transporter substrate-binding protein [Algoriphagus sp.]HAZ24899.1 ABC transporter substrate-binding protein [Algoriphagus sp.]|tara:strand:- start:310 stop:1182 length:873 start_codon:yes stop_codon:yes gene_type:complete
MKKIFALLISTVFLFQACKEQKQSEVRQNTSEKSQKIITAGGTITEVLFSLGMADQIIATDRTSTYPESMQELPSIGYRNQIKAEGILSLGPDLLLIEEGYLTDDVVAQLKGTGLQVELFKKPTSPEETKELVVQLGDFFDKKEEATTITAAIDQDLQVLKDYLSNTSGKPRAAFVMARGPESLFIAGKGSFAEKMFELAEIESAATGFEDFVPLTPESLIQIDPDYLVFFDSGIQSLGGKKGVSSIQGIQQTQAYNRDQIISLDGHYLSGFGPRVGKAALDLAKAVRGE